MRAFVGQFITLQTRRIVIENIGGCYSDEAHSLAYYLKHLGN